MSFYSQPNYYQSLLGISSIDNVNSNTINTTNVNTQNITVSTLSAGLVSSNASGSLQNANPIQPLSYNSTNSILSIALTGSTGVYYDIVGGVGRFAFSPLTGATGPIGTTGPIGPQGVTGYTGPQGIQGIQGIQGPRGETGYTGPFGTTGPQGPTVPANSSSVGELTIASAGTPLTLTLQNTFYKITGWTVGTFNSGTSPSSTNSNIVINSAGIYQTLASISFSFGGNAHIYNFSFFINGVQVPGHQSASQVSNANNVYSNVTLTGVVQMNVGDVVDLRARCTNAAGSTITIQETNMNLCVQGGAIGPTGYTGPVYTAGTNIAIASNVISTSLYPQFGSIQDSSVGTQNTLLNGFNYVSGVGAGGNTLVGSFAGFNVTTGGKNIALGLGSLYGGASYLTNSDGQNIGVGTSALGVLEGAASYNVGIGPYVAPNLTTGNNNLLIGRNAGGNISTSNNNVSIGNYSMGLGGTKLTSSTGSNTAVGNYAGYSINGTGVYNSLLGSNSGQYLTTGCYNVGVGYTSLGGLNSGSYNVAVGNNTLTGLTTGNSNIHIGTNTQSRVQNAQRAIVISAQNTTAVDKGDDTAFINCPSGFYSYIPYSINLWNNNAATVSQVEQWVLLNTANAGLANIGTTPTLTSGNITGLPLGVYSINVTGSLYGLNQTYYPTLQYKANGGSFVRVALAMPSFGGAWTCPFSLNANIRISNVNDAIRLWYDTGTPYTNTGTIPALYYSNYLPRYMTITFISL
jgi:hypothetical protein